MSLYRILERKPSLAKSVFVAPNAQIIGDVVADENASFWFGVVARADNARIHVGEGSNIQDNSVLHVDDDVPLEIGKNVTVGHRVILHGCTIEDDCLIGMGSIVMNGAEIGRGSVVAAGAVVLENAKFPPFSLIVGSPGKVVKTYKDGILENIKISANHYREKAAVFMDSTQFQLIS